MSKPENPPAFPVPPTAYGPHGDIAFAEEGMFLRDWFAGQALAGFCALTTDEALGAGDAAKAAYNYADAMLAERSK